MVFLKGNFPAIEAMEKALENDSAAAFAFTELVWLMKSAPLPLISPLFFPPLFWMLGIESGLKFDIILTPSKLLYTLFKFIIFIINLYHLQFRPHAKLLFSLLLYHIIFKIKLLWWINSNYFKFRPVCYNLNKTQFYVRVI